MSYYKIINGVRYDRELLDNANRLVQGKGDGRISEKDIKELFDMALDSKNVTKVEQQTLSYIKDNFNLTEKALSWLDEQDFLFSGLEKSVHKVVRKEFGLDKLELDIDMDEIDRQEALGGKFFFEEALADGLELLAQINNYRGFISPYELFSLNEEKDSFEAALEVINQGKLYLLPINYKEHFNKGEFLYEIPRDNLKVSDYWIFGLELPQLPNYRIFAFKERNGRYGSYAKIFMSTSLPLEDRIKLMIEKYLETPGLQWHIDEAELERQKELNNAVAIEDVIYNIITLGLTNNESSVSFYDYLSQEVWIDAEDPDISFDFFMMDYLRNGVLYLIPFDYEKQVENGSLAFPLSPYFSGDIEDFWYFGLNFPGKSNVHYQLIMNRDDDEPRMEAWSDGFITEELTPDVLQHHIFIEEFGLEGLQWDIPLDELSAQHSLDPVWRNLGGVFRQTINTYLYDDQTPESLFQIASSAQNGILLEHFDREEEYKAAIRLHIKDKMRSGQLSLLPRNIYDLDEDATGNLNPPPDGASIEENYVFQLILPQLSDHVYFAVIPRRVSEENPPYNYGFN